MACTAHATARRLSGAQTLTSFNRRPARVGVVVRAEAKKKARAQAQAFPPKLGSPSPSLTSSCQPHHINDQMALYFLPSQHRWW
jgi:hypothetical protein